MSTDVARLTDQAREFGAHLKEVKAGLDTRFYHSDILANVPRLDELLNHTPGRLEQMVDGKPVADIGGADGDLAFFMEWLGHEAHLIDHATTSFNGLVGAQALKDALGSNVKIVDQDLDRQFSLPELAYGFSFFLGILYHLKNPFAAMEALSHQTRHCFLSTRVARRAPDGTDIENIPVAYLLDDLECNEDSTNYWIFSPVGLRMLLKRTRWHIVAEMSGGPEDSEPARLDRDERMYLLLRSRRA